MRSYMSSELAHIRARDGVRPRILVWIEAKNRLTGATEAAGFWSGDDDATFTIGGGARTYHGAGALLGADDLVLESGLSVRRMNVWLATAAPEVVAAVMGYDLRLAPAEVHRVLTDPLTHQPLATPHRIWKGWVDGAARVTPAKGLQGGRITLPIASAAMALTRSLTAKYSDESMRQRGGDRMFRYADVSGKVPIFWGEKKIAASGGSSQPPAGKPSGGMPGRDQHPAIRPNVTTTYTGGRR